MTMTHLRFAKSTTRDLAERSRGRPTRCGSASPEAWHASNTVFFATFVAIAGVLAVFALVVALSVALAGCAAPVLHIDRFSDAAGHLMQRSKNSALPAPDAADRSRSRRRSSTQGLGPDGAVVRYYNFDVQRDRPATLWRLMQARPRDRRRRRRAARRRDL